MSSQKRVWPFEPIKRAVERTGKPVGELARARGASENRAERLASLWRDGVEHGVLTLSAMDSLCVEVLGLHPIQIYGMDYFNPEYDAGHVGKPCRGCKGPKEPGQLHYCQTCKGKQGTCACGCGQPTPTAKAKYADRSHAPNRVA